MESLSDDDVIAWAFDAGNTSKPGTPRGMGLEMLRSFVLAHHGQMHVASHRGHLAISSAGDRRHRRPEHFQGTLIDILLNPDESRYVPVQPVTEDDIF